MARQKTLRGAVAGELKLMRLALSLAKQFPGFHGKKVGVVAATEDKEVLSVGYNMAVRNSSGKRPVLQAVENMVILAAKENKNLQGSVVYMTSTPCPTCVKTLWELGVQRVVCPFEDVLSKVAVSTKAMHLMVKLGMDFKKFS